LIRETESDTILFTPDPALLDMAEEAAIAVASPDESEQQNESRRQDMTRSPSSLTSRSSLGETQEEVPSIRHSALGTSAGPLTPHSEEAER
jgi:hypothetical protein